MTVFQLIEQLQTDFPNAEASELCSMITQLESRISAEIFQPAGLSSIPPFSETDNELCRPLLLEDRYRHLYLCYLSAYFAMKDCDWERANAFSTLFNQDYAQLAAETRKAHLPIQNTAIKGGLFQ